jgi:tetratricopeptide (TPR) repeat protein
LPFVETQLGEYQEALADYTAAIAADPASSLAVYNRGITHDRLGDFAAAVQDFSAALALDPSNADFYHNRGFSLRKLVRPDLGLRMMVPLPGAVPFFAVQTLALFWRPSAAAEIISHTGLHSFHAALHLVCSDDYDVHHHHHDNNTAWNHLASCIFKYSLYNRVTWRQQCRTTL